MNLIVLVKQVPDIQHIPEEAWDRDRGTLKRGVLDSILNPLDIQALTFALRVREKRPQSKIVCLTMGPPQAREVLVDCLSRGADEAVLLTDAKFAGADTPATAYALSQAIRRIAQNIFASEHYLIVSGMQSVDGDTAQVPPQVAEELGVDHVAYTRGFSFSSDGKLVIERIGPQGIERVEILKEPALVTLTYCMDPVYRSFESARSAGEKVIHEWNASVVCADKDRIGLKGSRTWVGHIFPTVEKRDKPCEFVTDVNELLHKLELDFEKALMHAAKDAHCAYDLAGKTPTYKGELWVYAEMLSGELTSVTLELLGKARELASPLNEKVCAVIAGDNVRRHVNMLFAAGADKVYIIEHPLLKDFLPLLFKKVISQIVETYRPQVMLFGATPTGRELAPRVAYAVKAGLTADCTALSIGDHRQGHVEYTAVLKQTRPALGGNIMATIMTKDSFCQMATVRPGVFKSPWMDESRRGEAVYVEPELSAADIYSKIVSVEPELKSVDLKAADIIVAGGRGIGSKTDVRNYLELLSDYLARWLNVRVEIAGSRKAVEEGFLGHERQVGQTGQSVQPRLYIAVGISGAIQHVTGMQGARLVFSINKDPKAKIFNYSDYGMTASFEDAIPELIEAIKKRSK